jgi:TolB-like protein/DNA-binding winged helix-turn-helix (wHTH) protein
VGQDFQIADWHIEPGLNSVSRNGTATRLEPKVMAVLVCLAQHAGEPVTKEELLRTVWPDTFVTEDVLKRSVFELRRVLEDDARRPRFIQTIPKSGYRLLVRVKTIDDAGDVALVPVRDEPSRASRRWRLLVLIIGLATLLMLVAVGGYKLLRKQSGKNSNSSQIRSIAVLPLENLSGDPAQQYFSDGMTDALITNLAQIGTLKVISRTSSMQYKQTKKSLREIASELNVEGIVEGTVQRSGDRMRITAQLIDGHTDQHLWANSYERDLRDAFALERDVTHDIANQVQGRITSLSQSPIPQPQTTNPKALEAYLRGIYHLNAYGRGAGEREMKDAARFFQQAIDADPSFVLAYIGMAKAHNDLPASSPEDVALSKKAAEKALTLDPKSAEALGILASIKWEKDLDWSGAEQQYRQSIGLNPNIAPVRDQFCTLLAETGHMEEALRECQIAQELEPDRARLPYVFYWRGEYARSIAMLRMMAEQHPEDGELHYLLFENYALNRMYGESVQELERALTLYGYSETAASIQRVFAAHGYEEALRQFAKECERLHVTKRMFVPVNLADVYATLGNKDRAFYWLDQAYSHRDMIALGEPLDYILVDPMLHPLRSDPRFKNLLRRIGLPQ